MCYLCSNSKMRLEIYIEKPITRMWFQTASNDLGNIIDTNYNRDISSLMKRLDTIQDKRNLIVIIDVDSMYYNEIIQQIKLYHPNVKMHAIGSPMKIEEIIILFKKGFYSFNEIGQSSVEIYNALKQTTNNNRHLSNDKMNEIITMFINLENTDTGNETENKSKFNFSSIKLDFTKKQKDVCDYLIKGYTYKEIASFLGISTFTVNQRAKTIYKKLNVKSRSELAYMFLN